jgi:dynein heavy chain
MNLNSAERVLELYNPFVFLLDEDENVTKFLEDTSKERKDYIAYVTHLRDTVTELNIQCPGTVRTQMRRVDAVEVNRKLCQCAQDCVVRLLRALGQRNQNRSACLVKQFEHLNARIMRTPNNEDQLTELENAVDSAENKELPALMAEYEDIKQWISLTYDLDHSLTTEDYQAIFNSSMWKTYANNLTERETDLKEDRARIEGKLVERRNKFQEELTTLVAKIAKFKDKGSVRMLEDYLENLNDMKKQLANCEVTMEDIHIKEELIGWEATEFEQLQVCHDTLEPYAKLWSTVSDVTKSLTKWTRSPLFDGELDPVQIDSDVQAMWRVAFKLKAQFEQDGFQKPANVAAKIKTDLDAFKEHIPLLHALCNPGLRDRHWQDISAVIGFPITPDPSFTLQRMLDMDIGQYVSEIGDIADSAGK